MKLDLLWYKELKSVQYLNSSPAHWLWEQSKFELLLGKLNFLKWINKDLVNHQFCPNTPYNVLIFIMSYYLQIIFKLMILKFYGILNSISHSQEHLSLTFSWDFPTLVFRDFSKKQRSTSPDRFLRTICLIELNLSTNIENGGEQFTVLKVLKWEEKKL